jgi:hypothetical protein
MSDTWPANWRLGLSENLCHPAFCADMPDMPLLRDALDPNVREQSCRKPGRAKITSGGSFVRTVRPSMRSPTSDASEMEPLAAIRLVKAALIVRELTTYAVPLRIF